MNGIRLALLVTMISTIGLTDQCGIKKSINSEFTGKIIGGVEAEPGEYPWQVSIQFTRFLHHSHFCGGSLINESWVLTAAHCAEGFAEYEMAIFAGKHDITKIEDNERMVRVEKKIMHADYDSVAAKNDIALLKLKEPLTLGDFINVICLPEKDQIPSDMVTVTGWGTTQEAGELSDVLMEVDLPLIPFEKCQQQYIKYDITEDMLCAGYDEGNMDACQGDSGGPLIAQKSGGNSLEYYLFGIVSWGEGCAHAMKPGVYTKVAHFRDWIKQNSGL